MQDAEGHDKSLLKDTHVANYFATSPPLRRIWVRHAHEPALETTNQNGVTVLQVMKVLCRSLSKRIGMGMHLWDLQRMSRTSCDCNPGDRPAKVGDLLERGDRFDGFSKHANKDKHLVLHDRWPNDDDW